MTTTEPAIDTEEADLQAVFDNFAAGQPLDPEIAQRVRRRGAKIRNEVFRKHGLVDIAVPAIRELRGELPE